MTIIGKIALCSVLLSFAPLTNAAEIAIDQLNKAFSQPSLTIKKGDKVVFKNGDDVTHNITILDSDDNANDKGLQKPGETINETFAAPGSYLAKCQIHPKMKMTIKVE
jgi:plastocyanin